MASKMAGRLKYWVPVSGNPETMNSPAMTDAVWLAHEGHILHLAGSGNDTLLFRYPLTGNFRFECETETPIVGRIITDGGLIYGGRGYHVVGKSSEFRVTDPGDKVLGRRFCHYVRQPSDPTFNRLSIVSTRDFVSITVNRHSMWTDTTDSQTSPWFGLKSLDEFCPLFRNLKLTGQPVIPRFVRMIDGNGAEAGGRSSSVSEPI